MAIKKTSFVSKFTVSQAPSVDSLGVDLQRLQNDQAGFLKLAEHLKMLCGIDLPMTPKNLSLMASRLRKVLTARGLNEYSDYITLVREGGGGVVGEFVQAMTTNTTHFFREAEHFDLLRTNLPRVIQAKRVSNRPAELRVWCAASSTGQEPYSILISILESGALPQGWELKFLATDIDLEVLKKAARAVYRDDEVENIPPMVLSKYFETETTSDGAKWWRVKKQFSSLIRFAPLNLVDAEWPFEKTFDVIFCRNVLIYFDATTAQRTVERLSGQLDAGGFLFVGHSECGHVRTRLVKTVAAAAYQRILAPVKSK